METTTDGLTRNALESRYGVARSNIYNRISGLKEQGYNLNTDNDGLFSAAQIELLDRLHTHLKTKGSTIGNFPRIDTPQDDPIGLSCETQDTDDIQALSPAIPAGLIELVQAIAHSMHPPLEPDPLANIRRLEEASVNNWYLSTSQVRGLIGVAPRHKMSRHGFGFWKVAKAGREMEWKIIKF